MRQVMLAAKPPAQPSDGAPTELPQWLQDLTQMPVVAAVLDAVRQWWGHHPLRLAALVAGDAGKSVIGPIAQRHPLKLVLGAVLVGGVLAWWRPWRRVVTPALLAGLLPQIMSKVLSNVPVQSWLSVLNTFTESTKTRASSAEPPPAAAPSEPSRESAATASTEPRPTPAPAPGSDSVH